jgi:hypothetical protein
MSYKIIASNTPDGLTTAITAQIAALFYPVGAPFVHATDRTGKVLCQAVIDTSNGMTNYEVLSAATPDDLAALVTTALAASWIILGQPFVITTAANGKKLCQALQKGATAPADAVTVAALAAKADLVTGKVPVAQLPVATNAAKGIAQFGSGTTVTAGAVTVP